MVRGSAAWHGACNAGSFKLGPLRSRLSVVRVRLAADTAGIGVVGDKRHQRDLPGPLDSRPKGTLMFGANTGAAPGFDLGPLGDEPPDLIDVFVIDVGYFFDAEGADFAPAYESTSRASSGASGAARATGPSAWPATAAASTTKSGWRSAWSSRGFCRHASSSPLFFAATIELKWQVVYRVEFRGFVRRGADARFVWG